MLDDLILAVAERPDDLSRRMVIADALIERGDPRGEFIALQCRHHDLPRARALLREHGEAWLSPQVRDVIEPGSAIFSRGFLSACRLRNHVDVRPALRALDWQTVRCVSNPSVTLVREMPWLTQLRAVPEHVAVDILKCAPAVQSLEVVGNAQFSPLMRVWREASGAQHLTSLRLVGSAGQFYPHWLDPLFREGAVPLRKLSLVVNRAKLVRWLPSLEGSPLHELAFVGEDLDDDASWWWARYAWRTRALRVEGSDGLSQRAMIYTGMPGRHVAPAVRTLLEDLPGDIIARARCRQELRSDLK